MNIGLPVREHEIEYDPNREFEQDDGEAPVEPNPKEQETEKETVEV